MALTQTSARNQYVGTVVAVREGAVNGVVTIDLGGPLIKADITMESIHALGITEGAAATAVVNPTSVFFAPGTARLALSARNQYAGTVTAIERGAVNGCVHLTTPEDLTFVGSLELEAIDELGLCAGSPAVAIVKSTDVMVGAPV